jgi:hypothetical protein
VAYDGDNISKTNTFIVIILFSHVGKISMLLAMYSRFLATYLIKKQADPIVVLWHLKRLCILDTIFGYYIWILYWQSPEAQTLLPLLAFIYHMLT